METADRLVTVLGSMKGAAMKLGQTFSVIDVGMVPEDFREEFQAKLAKLQAAAEPRPFKDMKKVVEQDLGAKLGCRLLRLRRGADRRRLDRPGLPRDPARGGRPTSR